MNRFSLPPIVVATSFLLVFTGLRREAQADAPRFLFGTPKLVEGINTPSQGEGAQWVTTDELEMFFTKTIVVADADIFVASRESTNAPFGQPVPVNALNNTPYNRQVQPSLSADGLTVYYVTGPGDTQILNGEIWTATRPSRSEPFGTPSVLFAPPPGVGYFAPGVSADGLSLYVQRANLVDDSDVYVTRRASVVDAWGEFMPVPELTDPNHWQSRPRISTNELTLVHYEGSDSRPARGGGDLAMLVRSSVNAPWSDPINLGSSINTGNFEDFGIISADGDTFYFTRRPAGSELTSSDILQAPILPFEKVSLNGQAGSYTQDFNSLGTDGTITGEPLPPGWTFTANDVVFNNATTARFSARHSYADVTNGGADGDADRALVTENIVNQEHGEFDLRLAIQDAPLQALELTFDLEVWRVFSNSSVANPAVAAFHVLLEADSGSGFVQVADLGTVAAASPLARPATGTLVDGNDAAYRLAFDSGLIDLDVPVGATLRARWITTNDSRATRFGIDNVVLRFVAIPEPSTSILAMGALLGLLGRSGTRCRRCA